eukprot:TRINITY_DN5153_c0_g2_i1.p1 TRINITY_DN5153_c0_g2~~TRINITY_DN5153_c0_g2_i1.p1  ORF type:complete len:658 (+),score=97.44 TRINITY_DN5153_c0_g2_i1:78-2051(+)
MTTVVNPGLDDFLALHQELLRPDRLSCSSKSAHLDRVLSRWDELPAVDSRGLLLHMVLQHESFSVEDVLKLVERGAPMQLAVMACIRSMKVRKEGAAEEIATLIGAAHMAGRGCEVCEDIKAMLAFQYRDAEDIETAPLQFPTTTLPYPLRGLQILPPTKEVERVCADMVRDDLLKFLVTRGHGDDRTRIELLVRDGAALPCIGLPSCCLSPACQETIVRYFKMLHKASCNSGRVADLLNKLMDAVAMSVSDSVRFGQLEDEGLAVLAKFRDSGLLGPFASLVYSHILEMRELADQQGGRWVGDTTLHCLRACEAMLMQYAEADRWYAQHLATMLSQRVSGDAARLIAEFFIATPADKEERRRVWSDDRAYEWKEFIEYYGDVATARRHWTFAEPACSDEPEPLETVAFDEQATTALGSCKMSEIDASSAVIDVVLHVEPAARLEPEIAAEMVALMEAGAVERQLDSAVLVDHGDEGAEVHADRLVVLQFNRCPRVLREALATGLPLKRCREELERAGLEFLLPCRNMVFVHPRQHLLARKASLEDTGVKPGCFYVIVAESLEHLIEESLAGMGNGAWARTREHLADMTRNSTDAATIEAQDLAEDSESEMGTMPYVILRTFIEFGVQPVRNAASTAQSTTELHGGGTNPRRFVLDM